MDRKSIKMLALFINFYKLTLLIKFIFFESQLFLCYHEHKLKNSDF